MWGGGCSGRVRRSAVVGAASVLAWALLLTIALPRAHGASRCSGRQFSLEDSPGTVDGVRVLSDYEDPVCITGGIRVTFTSAAGAQCAGGPCGYAGTYAWRPRGLSSLEVETDLSHGIRSRNISLDLGDDASVLDTVVQRAAPSDGQLTCTDRGAGEDGSYSLTATPSRVAVDLAEPDGPVYGSRCAGPLDGDFAAAMPSTTIGLHVVARGGQAIDLRHSAPFAAGGFTGEVVSTLVLHLGRPIKATRIRASPPGKTHTERVVGVYYALQALTGRAVGAVTTSATPASCGPLDACGLTGRLTFTGGSDVDGAALFAATAPLARPRRDLLAALGLSAHGDPHGISVVGFLFADPDLTLTSVISQGQGCTDRTTIDEATSFLSVSRGRLQFPLSLGSDATTDALRTRCPGPDLGDHAFAGGSYPRDVLRHRVIRLALHDASFHDGPYRVALHSALVLRLKRQRVFKTTLKLDDVRSMLREAVEDGLRY
jgi:hypothetical protein